MKLTPYAVMSFGGLIGPGHSHSHYPVPWGALNYDTLLGGYRSNITEQQLKDAPQFSDNSSGNRDWAGPINTTARRPTGIALTSIPKRRESRVDLRCGAAWVSARA